MHEHACVKIFIQFSLRLLLGAVVVILACVSDKNPFKILHSV